MKTKVILTTLLILVSTTLSAQPSNFGLYKDEKGKVYAQATVFNEKPIPRTYTMNKVSKKVNGFKVVEFEGLNYIFEFVGKNEYKGIQGFPSVYDHTNIVIEGTLTLPDAVAVYGDGAGALSGYFVGSKIEKIIFSPSIKYIGDAAFAHCRNLTEVVFPEGCTDVDISKYAFKGCVNLTTIKVPKGTTEEYAQKMNLPVSHKTKLV